MPSAEANTFNHLRWPEGWGANQVASSAVGLEPPLGSDSPRAVVARRLRAEGPRPKRLRRAAARGSPPTRSVSPFRAHMG